MGENMSHPKNSNSNHNLPLEKSKINLTIKISE